MTNIEEIWKPIEEAPTYKISNLARIKGPLGLLLQPSPCHQRKDYLGITLHRNGKKDIARSVHRLVAMAFIPNPNNYPEVNHIDADKLNNFASNLEWCTHAQNLKHASFMGCLVVGEDHASARFTNEQVIYLRKLFDENPKINHSQLAREYKVANSTMWRMLHRQAWRHI